MLKQIAVSDVTLGMYIQELCGSWLNHPFWKRRFLLDSESDLRRLQASAVVQVLIDTSKGLGVAGAITPMNRSETCQDAPPARVDAPPVPISASIEEEVRRARGICRSATAAVAEMFANARMGRAIEAEKAMEQVEAIASSIHRHPHALLSLARLKTADEYTYMHSVAVCGLMIALARQMNMSGQQVREAGVAGLLHDIGKIGVQDAVINKPGKLTDNEWQLMRRHPEMGHRILKECGQLNQETLDVCLHHHEKLDGSGYPHGLSGEQIPLLARMDAVCDVYDAVTSNRAYKAAWDPAEALHRMAQWSGHFDKAIFHAFVKTLGIFPVGAQVRLQSGRIGVVCEQSPDSLLRPKVEVVSPIQLQRPIRPQIIDLALEPESDRIVSREPTRK